MNVTQRNTLAIRNLLADIIGDVTAKSLFSGYGLFYGEHMFAIYQNEIFYLRAEEELSMYLKNKGAVAYSSGVSESSLSMSQYYRLPQSITQNTEEYKQAILNSISQIKKQKANKALSKKNRIKDLANLNIKYERLLAKINIADTQSLRAIGAMNAYINMKKIDSDISLDFFWKLWGALENKHVSLINVEEQKEILAKLNLMLIQARLRPEKHQLHGN